MPTVTFYPAAGANSPVDGWVRREGTNETFSTIRSGAGTGFDYTDADVELSAGSTSNRFNWLYRQIICFDTSSIPTEALITSATLSIYGVGKANVLGSPDLHVTGATPNSTSTLINSDYNQTQNTSFGNITFAAFAAGVYNDITLNASGIANISKTGVSKFALKMSWDVLGSYTGTWISGGNSYFDFRSADQAGTSQDPKLEVTYTIFVPTVTTNAAGTITATSAYGNGEITGTGGATVTERGVVYDTVTHGDPGNVSPAASDYPSAVTETGTFSPAVFSESVTGLTPVTTYYMRAYAMNSVGYSYGPQVSFTTLNALPIVTTQAVTDNTALTTATGNGNVTDGGSSTVTERGVVWSTSPTPTTSNFKASTSGTTGAFTAAMTGLLGGTLYYVRAYAINSSGTAYGSQVTFTSVDFLNPTDAYGDDSDYMTAQADTGAINISLSGDEGLTYGSIVSSNYTSSETTNTFGLGSTELWGKTWLGANLSDTNFRLKIAVGTNPAFHLYETFGFTPSDTVIVTGIEVAIKAKWDGAIMSVNHIKIKIYYGTSTTAVASGAQAFATDGGADMAGALMIYDGSNWRPAGEGEAGGSSAPANATYIVQTANASLSNEQALGALASGYMKVTTTTGVVSSQATPIPSTDGGTGNAFTKFTGPATSEKTFTLPNASATIHTTDQTITVGNGGTGATTLTGFIRGNGIFPFDALVGGILSNIRIYTSSSTWTKPSDLSFIIVEVIGAGGGGGGAASSTASNNALGKGGGAGGYSWKKIVAASLGSSEDYVVGAAGTAGSAGNNAGGTGGDSSFGTTPILTGNGGVGGTGGANGNAVAFALSAVGGAATGGDVNIPGNIAPWAFRASGSDAITGAGANSLLGAGGAARVNSGTGNTATGYGAGGGGAGSFNGAGTAAGGAGTQGLVRVYEFLA